MLSARSTAPRIASSDSVGRIALWRIDGAAGARAERVWSAHDFAAWTCAFDAYQPQLLYSGGDDGRLLAWDLRGVCAAPIFSFASNRSVVVAAAATANATAARTVALTTAAHSPRAMGVCSVQASSLREHLLASGCYDEQLRVWDTRAPQQPLATVACGGGTWRVQWHPHRADRMLVACMQAGVRVLDVADVSAPATLAHYTDHQSLAYGIDWCPDTGATAVVASCSFYDRALHIWQAPET